MTEKQCLESYKRAKASHPGMLIVFRNGDYFEMFGEDAETAAQVVGLTITRKGKTAMAGFGYTHLESSLRKLLQSGHRVAVCNHPEKH